MATPLMLGSPLARRVEFVSESYVAWVLRVWSRDLAAPVAVKIARPTWGSVGGLAPGLDLQARNALIRKEVSVRARLGGCRNLPAVLDAGRDGALELFVAEWIEPTRRPDAGSLGALEETVAVASTLSYLHEHGVAHGDLEPEHVIVSGGDVWLIDLGSAKILDGHARSGAVARDLFAMGCYVAERVLGSEAFPYRTREEDAHARDLTAHLLPLRDVDACAHIVLRALAGRLQPSAAVPYDSADELARELRDALAARREAERSL